MAQNYELNKLLVEKQYLQYPKTKPITWTAVLSGAMIAFGLTFMFNLLTMGIGLSIITTNEQGIKDLAFNGFIWTLCGSVIILFIAGWKAGTLIRICPFHSFHYHHEMPNNPNMNPNGPILQSTTTENVYTKKKCCCSHGMTHGFLVWVLYLMISLIFSIVVAQAASIASFKTSFLNIPLGLSQSITEDVTMSNKLARPGNQSNQMSANQPHINPINQNIQNPNVPAKPVTTTAARKAGADIIALFLIFAFGAAASSIGCYLGLLARKKCLANKMNEV